MKQTIYGTVPSKYEFIIGIDTGVNTGYALWDTNKKKLIDLKTSKLHDILLDLWLMRNHYTLLVRVEDARKRKWFGKAGKEQLQGAGSIKRDAGIWEDFLKDCNIPYEMVAPKNNKTKTTPEYFKKLTGWTKRTSVHSRDDAMLVFGY